MSAQKKSPQENVLTKQAVIDLANANADRTYISIHENVFDVTAFLDEVYNINTTKADLKNSSSIYLVSLFKWEF